MTPAEPRGRPKTRRVRGVRAARPTRTASGTCPRSATRPGSSARTATAHRDLPDHEGRRGVAAPAARRHLAGKCRARAATHGRAPFATTPSAWLADRKVKGRPLAERTRAGYRDLLDRFILPDVRPPAAAHDHPRAGGRSGTTGPRPTADLPGPGLRPAAHDPRRGGRRRLPAAEPRPHPRRRAAPSAQHKVRPATLAELEALTEAMPERYRLMVLLAAWCALRFGELTELRRGDVDTKDGVLQVRRAVVRVDGEFVVKDAEVRRRDPRRGDPAAPAADGPRAPAGAHRARAGRAAVPRQERPGRAPAPVAP